MYSLPFNEAPFLTAAKADVEAIKIAVATANSLVELIFIWLLWVLIDNSIDFALKKSVWAVEKQGGFSR